MSPDVFDGENPPEDDEEDLEADAPDDAGFEGEGADEAPAPATWAGRQQWSGLPDDEDEPSAGSDPTSGDAAAEAGLTEEFDSLEPEVQDDPDTEPADEDEDEAFADEGPEPADEFEFDEEDDADAGSGLEGADEPEPDDAEGSDPTSDDAADEADADDVEPADAKSETGTDADETEKPAAGATREADTLAAADQEEAREAAMQGLRDRTAEHAKKRGITDPGKAAAGAAAAGAADADADAADAEPEEAATAVAATAASAEEEPEAGGASGEKPPRSGLWPRFVAATFLIVASMAAATAITMLVYITEFAEGLGGLPGVEDQLDEVGDQKAQNFLIIGSDVRPDQSSKGLSDTTMLLRVDPDNAITQLSIPRDLRVNIPGHGIDKFNAAYSYGGPKLTLEVVKQLTDNRIPINHVVNVDFNGFADAVDAIGCVYVDVDRHYFNDNATAASFADQYAEIDIQAGYQRLCGFKALQYVRYRHEDNDIVRAARQQGFLREARQKVPPEKLLEEREKLLNIFTDYTTSDIDDAPTLLTLFKLMAAARDAQIAQIDFPFDSLDAEGYVTAGDEPLQAAVSQFLGESGGDDSDDDSAKSDGGEEKPKADGDKGKDKDKDKDKPDPEPDQTPEQIAASQMIDSTAGGQQYAAVIREQGGKDLKFPILYPTKIVASGNASVSDDSRYFRIDGGNDNVYHGYKFVLTTQGTTYPTAYYGVSGTDWLGAPLFANPSDKRKIGDREYSFYRDGGQLRMVAFERDKTMYWVTNTLDKLLTEPQMVAIAQNLSEAGT